MDSKQIVTLNPKISVIAEENSAIRCSFCHKSKINHIQWGPLCVLEDIAVHYFCMLFSSALRQNGSDKEGILGFLPVDLRRELRRGEKLKCKYCKLNRATLGCAVKQCKTSFHFSCGIPNGALNQFSDSFSSFCAIHKPKIEIPIPEDSWNCEICFLSVEKNNNPVWPPCCKRRVFHRLCIQNYAATSGYFFSCPCCKDKNVFIKAMKESGVYVPEQDAVWELEQGAFADLNQRYSKCDAEDCLCPHGRTYQSLRHRSWKIVRCGSCGSSAIHYSCGQLTLIKWKCPECISVLARDPSEYRMVLLEGEDSSFDSASDDEESSDFSTTDENCRLQIACRSSLVGVERDTNRINQPSDFVCRSTAVLPVAGNCGRIVYNKNFKKKFRMEVHPAEDNEEDSEGPNYDRDIRQLQNFAATKATSVSSYLSSCVMKDDSTNSTGIFFKTDIASFRAKLTKLSVDCQFQDSSCTKSSTDHISQARPAVVEHLSNPNLKALSKVRNLDISEYESKTLNKFVTLPSIPKNIITSVESKSQDIAQDGCILISPISPPSQSLLPCGGTDASSYQPNPPNTDMFGMTGLSTGGETKNEVFIIQNEDSLAVNCKVPSDKDPRISSPLSVPDKDGSTKVEEIFASPEAQKKSVTKDDIKIVDEVIQVVKHESHIPVIDVDENSDDILLVKPSEVECCDHDGDVEIIMEKKGNTRADLLARKSWNHSNMICYGPVKSSALIEMLKDETKSPCEEVTLSSDDEDEQNPVSGLRNKTDPRSEGASQKAQEKHRREKYSSERHSRSAIGVSSRDFDYSAETRKRKSNVQKCSRVGKSRFTVEIKRDSSI